MAKKKIQNKSKLLIVLGFIFIALIPLLITFAARPLAMLMCGKNANSTGIEGLCVGLNMPTASISISILCLLLAATFWATAGFVANKKK